MGCSFNAVIVPVKVQSKKDLLKFYEDYRNNLVEEYGGEEEFEGYSGDLASDNGELKIKKNLKIDADEEEEITDLENYEDQLLELCEGHCEKWGGSIAVRIGKQWAICGAYSD